jgi:hypothetical protein
MDADMKEKVDAMITRRILDFHAAMVRRGQIPKITKGEPPISHPSDDCSLSDDMPAESVAQWCSPEGYK